MDLPKSRAEAKQAGSVNYFTNKPCKYGHISIRNTKTGSCKDCCIAWEKKRAHTEPGFESQDTIRFRNYRVKNAKHYWAKEVFNHAKRRAKNKNLEFNLTVDHIEKIATSHCPVLGIELSYTRGDKSHARNNSPSLDRIRPEEGYTTANIIVVSYRANSIKQDATIEELKKIFKFYDAILPSVEEMKAMQK